MPRSLAKLDLAKVLQQDAKEIIDAREKALLIHSTKDIDAAGDQVERVVRNIIRRRLATNYYVGQGHVLDKELVTSPQLDVIIADNAGAPVLFRTENETEYFPYEAVYAIGEIKSSYHKNKLPIHAFSNVLSLIRSDMIRERTPHNYFSPNLTLGSEFSFHFKRPYRNPLFSFMLFVHSNDFQIKQIQEIYKTKPSHELPNIVCFLDKGVVINAKYEEDNGNITIKTINLIPEFSKEEEGEPCKWFFAPWGSADNRQGANFAYLIFLISAHLKFCTLMPPDLYAYLGRLFPSSDGGSIIA